MSAAAGTDLDAPMAREQGLSLVELLVVLAILGVVGTALMFSFQSVIRTTTFTEQEAQAQSIVRTVQERVARTLRQAQYPEDREVMFERAEGNRMTFYADLDDDDDLDRVMYGVSGSELRQRLLRCDSDPCDYSDWATTPENVLARHVRNYELGSGACQDFGADEPAFTYLDRSAPGELSELGNPVPPPLLHRIASVEINFVVDLNPEQGPECRRIQTVVHLRNWRG